jgi:uncharacterized protein (DUF302 family)
MPNKPRVMDLPSTREDVMSDAFSAEGMKILATRHGVPEVLQRVQSLARERGLTVFAQIDFSGDAARSGLAMHPTGLLILGNPKGGTPLMVAAPTTAIDLPLKVLAWTDAEGRTWLAYNEPAYLQSRHRFPAGLSKNIEALGALAAAAAGDP